MESEQIEFYGEYVGHFQLKLRCSHRFFVVFFFFFIIPYRRITITRTAHIRKVISCINLIASRSCEIECSCRSPRQLRIAEKKSETKCEQITNTNNKKNEKKRKENVLMCREASAFIPQLSFQCFPSISWFLLMYNFPHKTCLPSRPRPQPPLPSASVCRTTNR